MTNKSLSENMAVLNEDNLQKRQLITDLQNKNEDQAAKVDELSKTLEKLSREKIALQDQLNKVKNNKEHASHKEIFEKHLKAKETKCPEKLVRFSAWGLWGVGSESPDQYGQIVMCATREQFIVLYTGAWSQGDVPYHMIQVNDMRGRQISMAFKTCTDWNPVNVLLTNRHIICITHKGKSFFVVHCTACQEIKVFESASLSTVTTLRYVLAEGLCSGPNGSIVYLDPDSYGLKMLKMESSHGPLKDCGILLTMHPKIFGRAGSKLIAYDAESDIFVIADRDKANTIIAYHRNLKRGSASEYPYREAWYIGPDVDGHTVDITGICTDNLGLVYISDGSNKRVLVLESQTGKQIPVEFDPPQNFGHVDDVTYCEANEALIIRHTDNQGDQVITCFNVPMRMPKQRDITLTSSKSQTVPQYNKKEVTTQGTTCRFKLAERQIDEQDDLFSYGEDTSFRNKWQSYPRQKTYGLPGFPHL